MSVRNPEELASLGLASSAFARHYLRNLGWCLFLALLRCFSSGRSLRTPIWFNARCSSIAWAGSPIRKSTDITDICSSPWLIAACHVLLRLLMPSHSPYALYSLTNLVWFLNYIRIRDLFLKLKFLPIYSRISKKPFHISLITNLVIGVWHYYVISSFLSIIVCYIV